MGAMYSSRLSPLSFSASLDIRIDCSTLLNPRRAVAATARTNPPKWKLGSAPVARAMPSTTGIRVRYVVTVSFFFCSTRENTAVKRGVVAPMACVKDTGM